MHAWPHPAQRPCMPLHATQPMCAAPNSIRVTGRCASESGCWCWWPSSLTPEGISGAASASVVGPVARCATCPAAAAAEQYPGRAPAPKIQAPIARVARGCTGLDLHFLDLYPLRPDGVDDAVELLVESVLCSQLPLRRITRKQQLAHLRGGGSRREEGGRGREEHSARGGYEAAAAWLCANVRVVVCVRVCPGAGCVCGGGGEGAWAGGGRWGGGELGGCAMTARIQRSWRAERQAASAGLRRRTCTPFHD